jgi:hypothetical protein
MYNKDILCGLMNIQSWPMLKTASSNKSTRIHVTKEYNNENTTNTLTNKWKAVNYKSIICHKSTNTIGALVMMCGRDEECFISVTTR